MKINGDLNLERTLYLGQLTQTERDNLVLNTSNAGATLFNTTLGSGQIWDGTTWTTLGAGLGGGSNFANADLTLNANRSHDLSGNDLNISDAGVSRLVLSTNQILGNATGVNFIVVPATQAVASIANSHSLLSSDNSISPELRFSESSNVNFVSLRAPLVLGGTNTTYILPTGVANSGDVLSTDGLGTMSWITPISAVNVDGVSITGDGANDPLVASNFGNTNLTLDGGRTHNLNANVLFIVDLSPGPSSQIILSSSGISQGLNLTNNTQSLISEGGTRLDVLNSGAITTTSEALEIRSNAVGSPGRTRIYDDDATDSVGFQAPLVLTSSTMWTLPTGDGTNGQQLTTDGGGTLSWGSPIGNTDGVSITGDGVTNPLVAANFANTNLTANTGRIHSMGGNSLSINTASTISLRPVGTLGLRLDANSAILGDSSVVQPRLLVDYTQDVIRHNALVTRIEGFTGNVGVLRIVDDSASTGVGFTVPSGLTVGTTYTLPATDGAEGAMLTTDGNEILGWEQEETIFGTTNTLSIYGGTRLDPLLGNVSGTLPDGSHMGLMKTIINDGAPSGDIRITNHLQGTNVDASFPNLNDTLVLLWNGNVWVTMFASASI